MYDKLAYSPLKDFIAVARINHFPSLLVAHPSVPVKTVADLINGGKGKKSGSKSPALAAKRKADGA